MESARSTSGSLYALLVLLVLGLGQLVYQYPHLPQTIASHFGPGGQPDDWSSKQAFTAIMAAAYVGLTLLFAGIAALLPRMPASMINMPRREYWLAPERKPGTLSRLARDLHWVGIATLLLLIVMNQLTFQANTRGQGLSPLSWVAVGIYLLLVLAWTARMIWRYARIPRQAGT